MAAGKQDIYLQGVKMEPDADQITFIPYQVYRRNVKSIEDFWHFSRLSSYVTASLSAALPDDKLQIQLQNEEISIESFSSSMGERNSFDIQSWWVNLESYADLTGLDLEEVRLAAQAGALGSVQKDPETNDDVVIFPPEMRNKPLSELPKPGYIDGAFHQHYRWAKYLIDNSANPDSDQVRKQYLHLAKSLFFFEGSNFPASDTLNRVCFLQEWVFFEVFLKITIRELITRHPHKLASMNKNNGVSYEDIINSSMNLTSIESLKSFLIEQEIERQQSGNRSVHGLIIFMKKQFKFEQDPFNAWYVFKGQKMQVDYNDLMQIKDTRNVIVHDGGVMSPTFVEKYPNLKRQNNEIFIKEDYYLKASLILRSIAYSIARSIDTGQYKAL